MIANSSSSEKLIVEAKMFKIKSSLRRGSVGATFAFAALASLVTGAAKASDFSEQDCTKIVGVTTSVAKELGPQTLSAEFKRSMREFLKPNGTADCSGPRDILTPTVVDVAAFNTMRTLLLAGSHPVSLQKAGLRSVDPATLAGRPTATKRSDAGSSGVSLN